MEYIVVAWLVFIQTINIFLGIKSIMLYILGLFLLTAFDGYKVITHMQFANIVVVAIILILFLLILNFFRKKAWAEYNLPVYNLVLLGISNIFVIGALTRPSIGLMTGGTVMALPIGRVILFKGFLGIAQLYIISVLQWVGLLMINIYALWSIINNLA